MTDWGDEDADLGGWGEEEEEEEQEETKSTKKRRVEEKRETRQLWPRLPTDVILAHVLSTLSLKELGKHVPLVSKELRDLTREARTHASELVLDEREWAVGKYSDFLRFAHAMPHSQQAPNLVKRFKLATGDPSEFLTGLFFPQLFTAFRNTEVLQLWTLPLNIKGRAKPMRPLDEVNEDITFVLRYLDKLRHLEWVNQSSDERFRIMLVSKIVETKNETITRLVIHDHLPVGVAPLVHWVGAPRLELLDLTVSLSVYADADEAKESRLARQQQESKAVVSADWGCAHVGRIIDRCAATLQTLRLSIHIPADSAPSNVHESMADLLLGLKRSPQTLRELHIRFTGRRDGQPSLPQQLLRDLSVFTSIRTLDIEYPTATAEIAPAAVNGWADLLGAMFNKMPDLHELHLDLPDVMRAYIATAEDERLLDAPLLWKITTQRDDVKTTSQINEQRLMRWTSTHAKLEQSRILHRHVRHVVTENKQSTFQHMVQWAKTHRATELFAALAGDVGPLSTAALPLLDDSFETIELTELGQARDVQIDRAFLAHVTQKNRTLRRLTLPGSIAVDSKQMLAFLNNIPKLNTLTLGTKSAAGAGPLRAEPAERVLPLLALVAERDTGGELAQVAFYSGMVGASADDLRSVKSKAHGWTEIIVVVPTAITTTLSTDDFKMTQLTSIWSSVAM